MVDALDVAPPYHVLRVGFSDVEPNPDRATVLETPRDEPIDVAIRFDHLEKGSADFVAEGNAKSILEFHLMTPPSFRACRQKRRGRASSPRWRGFYPELKGGKLAFAHLEAHHNFTSYGVGQKSKAPTTDLGAQVGIENLLLAGDLVKLPFPGKLMEGAAASGRLASRLICEAEGVREAPLPVLRG